MYGTSWTGGTDHILDHVGAVIPWSKIHIYGCDHWSDRSGERNTAGSVK